jgi:hypothetical protein
LKRITIPECVVGDEDVVEAVLVEVRNASVAVHLVAEGDGGLEGPGEGRGEVDDGEGGVGLAGQRAAQEQFVARRGEQVADARTFLGVERRGDVRRGEDEAGAGGVLEEVDGAVTVRACDVGIAVAVEVADKRIAVEDSRCCRSPERSAATRPPAPSFSETRTVLADAWTRSTSPSRVEVDGDGFRAVYAVQERFGEAEAVRRESGARCE